MNMRASQLIVWGCGFASFFLLASRSLVACSFFWEKRFESRSFPDQPLDDFASGKLGLIQPTWARSYLVVAYRYLSGRPLDAMAQEAALAVWSRRGKGPSAGWLERDPRTEWLARCEEILGTGPDSQAGSTRDASPYQTFVNCGPSGYATALETLTRLEKESGGIGNSVLEWLEAQQSVFSNCDSAMARIPPPLPAGRPHSEKADRDYQIAAAHFYAMNYDEARHHFEEIAQDDGSPWRALARLLVARSSIRQGTLCKPDGVSEADLARAESELRAILSDPALVAIHRAATDMLHFVEIRLNPESRIERVAKTVLEASGENFESALEHYTDLFDAVYGRRARYLDAPRPEPPPSDELTLWLLNVQRGHLAQAHSRYCETASLPWLITVLLKGRHDTPIPLEILEDACKVDHGTPGFVSATALAALEHWRRGRREEAYRAVVENQAALLGEGPSARNVCRRIRSTVARTFDEFLAQAPQEFLFLEEGVEEWKENKDLGPEVLDLVNTSLPLEKLEKFCAKVDVGLARRERFTDFLFTRAYLLGDIATARRNAPPQLDPTVWDRDWRFEVMFKIFLSPSDAGGHFDSNLHQETWGPGTYGWCRTKLNLEEPPPPFLTSADISRAREALAVLRAQGASATFFCREALKWAKKNPLDPRAPEVLHRAIQASRIACADESTATFSRAAFQHLHRHYANTEWARRTKYWYAGVDRGQESQD